MRYYSPVRQTSKTAIVSAQTKIEENKKTQFFRIKLSKKDSSIKLN